MTSPAVSAFRNFVLETWAEDLFARTTIMQDPAREIAFVVSSITSSPTPDIQREAVTKYFTDDAGFRNPFFFIKPGPLSREDVLGVYQYVPMNLD